MSRIAYVNGRYLPHAAASVHIEDRGYQFADGVYEVIAVHKGVLIDGDWHMERLQRSLSELQIRMPMAVASLNVVLQETGFGEHLPTGLGLFAVRTSEQAAAAIEAVISDYDRHSRAAREIASEHLDGRKVLARFLREIGC